MVDIHSIIAISGASLGALNGAADISQKLKDIFGTEKPDLVASKQLVLELLNSLVDAQMNHIKVERLLADLQEQLNAADRFANEAARYELATTDMGGRVYALKKDDPSDEPAHEICADCYERSKKRILQPSPDQRCMLVCNTCGAKIRKDDGREIGIAASSSGRGPRNDGFW